MNSTQWIELAINACEDAGIAQDSIDIITTWDETFTDNDNFRHNAVFRINNQHILKIYGTDALRHFNIESAVLRTLNNQIPAPRIIASGTLENSSPYIIMSEVRGKTLQQMWAELTPTELRTIAREIGNITANLHRQPQDKLAAVESQFGGRSKTIKEMQSERIAEIKVMDKFSTRHKDELLEFLHGEAQTYLDNSLVLTHSDLSHAHIYVARENQQPIVSGWIDWGEAMLGPAEWDITFHWFWTFSQDKDTMRECLNSYYQDNSRADRYARCCFATHLYTFSMREVWDYFNAPVRESASIVQAMITALFPQEIFGAPD